MQILSVEKLKWYTWEPQTVSDFPCMICKRKIGTLRLKCRMSVATVNLSVCESCAKLDPAEILHAIKD